MQTIGTLDVEQESMVVLYDAETGRIVHCHAAFTAKGGNHPDKATLESNAQRQLSLAQRNLPQKTAALHLSPREFKQGFRFRVDVKLRTLVSEGPLPLRRPITAAG
jgi:hypothetical protein